MRIYFTEIFYQIAPSSIQNKVAAGVKSIQECRIIPVVQPTFEEEVLHGALHRTPKIISVQINRNLRSLYRKYSIRKYI